MMSAATDEEDTGGFEMADLSTSGKGVEEGGVNAGAISSPGPAAQMRRRKRNFVWTVIASVALAAAVYLLASVDFAAFGTSDDTFDDGSGEVGLDADNAETQKLVDEEVEEAKGGRGHGKANSAIWWNKHGKGHLGKHNAGQGKDWVRNYTYWRDHPEMAPPSIDKDKLEKLQKFYNQNRTGIYGEHSVGKDGLCELMNGQKIPCPETGDKNKHQKDNGKQQNVQKHENTNDAGYKITLKDGKKYEVLAQLPHDPTSFTQGLTYANGMLYESTGLKGQSKVRQLNPDTGELIKSIDMNAKLFGEGLAHYDDGKGDGKLIQITWKNRKGFIYDAKTLDVMGKFAFSTTRNEGWGITFNPSDKTFIVSDGSRFLHFWDVDNPGVDKKPKVEVKRQSGGPANNLNELEFVDGKVLSNVWYEDILLVIDPETGVCEMEYDFSTLWPIQKRTRNADVLNGISVSGQKGVLFITGKLWDRIYKVKLEVIDSEEEENR